MNNVEAYINKFPAETKKMLEGIRNIIKGLVPNASEDISYGMPSYKLNGKPLVYFAWYKKHIGLYALPTTNEKFKSELSDYKQGKGSIQFPIDKPLPTTLIYEIIKYRVSKLSNA